MERIEIRSAEFPRDVDIVRGLFREYAAGLEIDLAFQDFDSELASLPGKYAQPAGHILLAWRGEVAVACAALRPINAQHGELKRLYVRAAARGEYLGRELAQRICDAARRAGYSRLYLDTLDTMHAARALYRSMGFVDAEPYVYNPLPNAKFMSLDLSVR